MRESQKRRSVGVKYELGPMIRADRRTRLHEALPAREGLPPGVAKLPRREMRRVAGDAVRAEGALLGRVRHAHVARVYDAGESPEFGTYFIREKIEGDDLAGYLRREGAQTPERTAEIARALAAALRALEDPERGVPAIEPTDVWVEDRTGRIVLASAAPDAGTVRSRYETAAHAIADVLIGCGRGHLPSEERERARARVEVLQAQRSGSVAAGVSAEVGEIIEACVVRGAESEPPRPADLELRLGWVGEQPEEMDAGEGRAACRARAVEVEGLLQASVELDLAKEELPLPNDLPRLLARAEAARATGPDSWQTLEAQLAAVAADMGGVLESTVSHRAEALQGEWTSFQEEAGPFAETVDRQSFAGALRRARSGTEEARFEDASEALRSARDALGAARDEARDVAEQQTRSGVDALAQDLDALEASHPSAELDPSLEPKRIRRDAQALVEEGRLAEALAHVDEARRAVGEERARREKAVLHSAARAYTDRAISLRRDVDPVEDTRGVEALDGVERRLTQMVDLLGSDDLDAARSVSGEIGAELKRLDWERELSAAERDGPPPVGLFEIDDARGCAARLLRGEDGPTVRRDLIRALDALQDATRGAWEDAIARLRQLVGREAWGAVSEALGGLRAQMVSAAADPGGVEFRPSPEISEVLRVLAEAESEAPPPSEADAAKLKSLRERGEAMLARLDSERARAVAPDLVDRLVEHCAAAAEAERRGDHAEAIAELEAANAVLAELEGEAAPESGIDPMSVVEASGASVVVDAERDPVVVDAARVAAPPQPAETGSGTGWQAVDRRAYLGLFLAMFALAWWTWAPSDWWESPRGSRAVSRAGWGGSAAVAPSAPSGLFPTISAAHPPGEVLVREALPSKLWVVVDSASTGERPPIVWWLGDRIIARGGTALDLHGLRAEADLVSAPLRVTVGEGTRAQQSRVWQVR